MLSQAQRLASIGARQIAFYIETKDKISYYISFMQLIDQDRAWSGNAEFPLILLELLKNEFSISVLWKRLIEY
ncbi:hypothetical protein LIMHP_04520 [Leptospira interrogans serovar Manilae]|nr:hypothetical protein LIMLP_04535 [Leptospira interrogans serovar Manilae]AKP29070.1 hypothetical protein LIMHP_04520 [Leptospira interrogans serovar Manilae]EYU64884.1 hypothetical protein CI00_02895 [Leptospira interrogans serovar Manilae]